MTDPAGSPSRGLKQMGEICATCGKRQWEHEERINHACSTFTAGSPSPAAMEYYQNRHERDGRTITQLLDEKKALAAELATVKAERDRLQQELTSSRSVLNEQIEIITKANYSLQDALYAMTKERDEAKRQRNEHDRRRKESDAALRELREQLYNAAKGTL